MALALILTGPPGAGKSSVLEALATRLEIEGVPHGAIETEQLTRGFPPLAGSCGADQLATVLQIQREAGRRLFLVVATTETAAELGAVLAATRAERSLIVCLRADPDVLTERLQRREPDLWPGKRGLIAHARALAGSIPRLEGIDLLIDTNGREVGEVAEQLVREMRSRGLLLQAPGSEGAGERHRLLPCAVASPSRAT